MGSRPRPQKAHSLPAPLPGPVPTALSPRSFLLLYFFLFLGEVFTIFPGELGGFPGNFGRVLAPRRLPHAGTAFSLGPKEEKHEWERRAVPARPPLPPGPLCWGQANANISGGQLRGLVCPCGDNSSSNFPLSAAQERADPSLERPGSPSFVASISLFLKPYLIPYRLAALCLHTPPLKLPPLAPLDKFPSRASLPPLPGPFYAFPLPGCLATRRNAVLFRTEKPMMRGALLALCSRRHRSASPQHGFCPCGSPWGAKRHQRCSAPV